LLQGHGRQGLRQAGPGYYFNNWDTIATSLDGDVAMIVIDQPDLRIAKFVSSFAVRNSKKALAGKT